MFVLYAAKSTKNTNGSIESQFAEMQEYVEDDGGEIVGEFSDEAVSGFSKSRGPGLVAAQKKAADTTTATGADVVLLAFDADRFARGDGRHEEHSSSTTSSRRRKRATVSTP